MKQAGNAIYKGVSKCIEDGLGPRDKEVQNYIEQHVRLTNRFYTVSKDVYVGLSQLYCEHSGFRKFFDPFHPELAEFFAEAMRVYAHKNLK